MVWSKWLGPFVVTMAWAGLALSQQPSPAPSGGERILTLRETGGIARRCRVVAAWTMLEGGKALQVQDVESGETITVVQNGASKSQRIIHWGKNTTPPPGVPVPPPVEPARVEAPPAEAPKVELPKVEAPPAGPVIINGEPPSPKANAPAMPVIINAAPPADGKPTATNEAPPVPTGERVVEHVQPAQPAKELPESVVAAPPVAAPPDLQVPARIVETKEPADFRASWGKTTGAEAPPLVPPPSAGRPDPATTPGFFPRTDPRPTVNTQAPPFQPGQPLDGKVQRVPAGMQSVLAAGDGQAQYIPVPIMTQPPVVRMPQAPNPVRQQPGMPEVPSDQFVNAFTPPPQANQQPMPMAGYGTYPRGMMPQMPQTYRPMYPPGPMVPLGYQGPMPQMPYGARPPMPMAPQAAHGAIEQQVATLKNALYPSHREMAVMHLAGYNAQYYPQVVRALVTAAKDDPAATVRAACVGGLMRMQANAPEVVGMLTQLRNDDDPRVRQEVDQALARLAPGLPPAAELPNVQPAGATQMPTLP